MSFIFNFFKSITNFFVELANQKEAIRYGLKKGATLTGVVILQILSSSPFFSFQIDITTPLLIYFMIKENETLSFLLAMYGALLLEGTYFFPLGFYFCSYSCFWLFLTATREYIRWQNAYTWLSFLFLSQILIVAMEVLLSFIMLSVISSETIFYFVSSVFIRFITSIVIFILLSIKGLLAFPKG